MAADVAEAIPARRAITNARPRCSDPCSLAGPWRPPPTSIAGDYGCYYKGDLGSPQVGYELRPDGTFTMHSFDRAVDNTTGTWTVQGDSGTFEVKGTRETFAIRGDYLVFAEHPPREWFVMSYDPPSSVTGFVCFRNPGRASPSP